jgi:hypothetical protein
VNEPSGRLHTCAACGRRDVWRRGWLWLGTQRWLEQAGELDAKVCSNACRERYEHDRGRFPVLFF